MDVKQIFLLCALAGVSACATTPYAPIKGETGQTSQGLSARTLAIGECGLFIWTANAEKQFILFSQSQNARAAWLSPQGEMTLTTTSRSGAATQGQFPVQLFKSQNYGPIELTLRDPQSIINGTRYRAGTLKFKSENGWDRVTPVVGLSACKPLSANKAS